MNAIAQVLHDGIGVRASGVSQADRRRAVARFLDVHGDRARQASEQAQAMAADSRERVAKLRDMVRGAVRLGLTSAGFENVALDFPARTAADKRGLQAIAADLRERLADIDEIKHTWSQAWRNAYALWLEAVEGEIAAIDETARGLSVLFARQLAAEVRQRLANIVLPDSRTLLRLDRDSA